MSNSRHIEPWRLIGGRGLSSAEGLAVDEALAVGLGRGWGPPALHLYTFRPAVILGRYQDLAASVDEGGCRRLGFEVNRRHTGGGTVIMGPDQVAVGFALPFPHPALGGTVASAFESVASMTISAIRTLGVEASFRPKNDIEVEGRKLAGLSASVEEPGVFFFHMSLLMDFSIPAMVELLRIYPEKRDKAICCFQRRMGTLQSESGNPVTFDQTGAALVSAYESGFGVELRPGELVEPELEEVRRLRSERYESDRWVRSTRVARPAEGVHRIRTPGGVLEVRVWLAGSALERVLLMGDFFARAEDVNRIESALKWIPAVGPRIRRAILTAVDGKALHMVELEDLVSAVVSAAEKALNGRETPSPSPSPSMEQTTCCSTDGEVRP